MHILLITPGPGRIYCGDALRDLALVGELKSRGHKITLIPLFASFDKYALPVQASPVFYAGVNLHLAQRVSAFPARTMSRSSVRKIASRLGIRFGPGELGPTTISLLMGAYGRHKRELDELMTFLSRQPRPDVVCLGNCLCSGLAKEIKDRMQVPIACLLGDGINRIRAFPQEIFRECRTLLRRNCRNIDLFLACCQSQSMEMTEFLAVAPKRMQISPAGLATEEYSRPCPRPHHPFTIGYLGTIPSAKGLDILVAAFASLVNIFRHEARLMIRGQIIDHEYWERLQDALRDACLDSCVTYKSELEPVDKTAFLHQLSVLAIPSRQPEFCAVAAIEAMAASVPIIAPTTGVFPELVGKTSAGILVPPEDSQALVNGFEFMLDDPENADDMGLHGATTVNRQYTAISMTRTTERLLEKLIS